MDWEAQWKQLKTELDALNPKYDAATARIRELEATLALREKEKAEAEGIAAQMAVRIDNQAAAIASERDAKEQAQKALADTQAELSKHKARADKAVAGLNAANAAQAVASKAITEALHASV